MVPKPAKCIRKQAAWYMAFLPSWATLFGGILGFLCSVPVPVTLIMCFRKSPIMDILTPEEKNLQVVQWRVKTAIGWTICLSLNIFICYYLAVFSNEYEWPVFEKWVSAAAQSLLHRFFTAPVGRGLVFGLIVACSKFFSACDCLLMLFPFLIPPDPLRQPTDDDADDFNDMDFDMGL